MARINVDTSQQTLDVKVTPDKKSAGPGDNVTYTIVTRDQAGKPVSGDVSLAVVDKAALALAPSNSAPILNGFYPDQGLAVQTALGLVASADDFNSQLPAEHSRRRRQRRRSSDQSLGHHHRPAGFQGHGLFPGAGHDGCKRPGASDGETT